MIKNCEQIDLSTECRIVRWWRERVPFIQSVIGMKKIFMPFQFEVVSNEEGGGGVQAITERVHNWRQNVFVNGH